MNKHLLFGIQVWLPGLGSENAPRVVVFNTLLIGPHSNSSCNMIGMIRGNFAAACFIVDENQTLVVFTHFLFTRIHLYLIAADVVLHVEKLLR